MKKKVIRCIEAKTLNKLRKERSYHVCATKPGETGYSPVYYGFDGCKDDSKEHVQALKTAVESECKRIGWGAPTTIPMSVCKIKPQQSKIHAYMTMVKVMVPNDTIVAYFGKKHIEL